jgi:peptidoglycan/xylan/chitin deacetylase (PgdA/CDA1 family)
MCAQHKKLKSSKLTTIVLAMLILLSSLVSLATIQTVSATRGTVSITFDDGFQTQYDYAFPLLQARGIKATFYVITASINTPSFMTATELVTLQNNGHEIGSHSDHHYDLPNLPEAQIRQELQVSQQKLRSWGLTANNFAYPDAARTAYTDSIVHDYYRSARGGHVGPFTIQLPTSLFYLPAQQGDYGNSSDLPNIKALVEDAYNSNCWVIIVFHNVVPGGGTSQNTISSANFASFLDYIQTRGVATLTVAQALNLAPSPTPAPTPTLTPSATPMPSPTPTPTPTAVPTPIPTPTDSPTPTPTPTDSPTPTPTSTPRGILSATTTPTPTQEATTPTETLSPTPIPTPTATTSQSPTSTTILATTDSGTKVNLSVNGNITSLQMSRVTIATNQSATSTAISFTLTGKSGTIGFGNLTIPKTAEPYGNTPIIYIDNQTAENQGYTQDSNNFFVWYTTHFSTHEVSIVFTKNSSSSLTPEVIFGITVAVIIMVIAAVVLVLKKKK